MPAIPPSPACSVRSSSALPPSSPPLDAPSPAFLAPELQKPFAVRPEERAPPSSELPLRDDAPPPPAPAPPVLCYCERPAALLDGRWVCAQLVEGDFCILGRENE